MADTASDVVPKAKRKQQQEKKIVKEEEKLQTEKDDDLPVISFQLMSDLHLEFLVQDDLLKVPKVGDYLFLAGDIGNPRITNYEEFLMEQCDQFPKGVFVVAGNHEYYRSSLKKTENHLKEISKKRDNLHIMCNDRVQILPNVRILGTTLWANIQSKSFDQLSKYMADFRQIYPDSDDEEALEKDLDYISPQHQKRWHQENVQWLRQELVAAQEEENFVIIITHHAPITEALPPNKAATFYRSAYVTNLTKFCGGNVLAWCYGHTHVKMDKIVEGTRILSNPKGYKREKLPETGKFLIDQEFRIPIRKVSDRVFTANEKRCMMM